MISDYQIWITSNGESEKLMLPVNPDVFTVTSGSNNDTVDIAELGEITIRQGRPALQFSFSGIFPKTYFPGCKTRAPDDPMSIVKTLREWQNASQPVHFVSTGFVVDLHATIERFIYSENGGDVGTVSYSLTFKEYREVTTRKVVVSNGKATVHKTATRVDNTTTPKTVTVVKGDSLWIIARRVYGDGAKYMVIYNANKSVIGGNPNLIYLGQVLSIPSI